MKKYKFLDIFQENSDGTLTPKVRIIVNGVEFGPGISFAQGVSFSGVDFHLYKYLDIAVEEEKDGALVIKGFYKQ